MGHIRMLNWMKRSLGGLPFNVWQLWNKDAIRPAIWSPAVVVAYLMKNKGRRLGRSYQWVKERRPSVDITPAVYQQLQDYEQKIFGNENHHPNSPGFSSSGAPAFSFGFPKPSDAAPIPVFNNTGATSIFRSTLDVPPQEFTFGATQTQNTSDVPLV